MAYGFALIALSGPPLALSAVVLFAGMKVMDRLCRPEPPTDGTKPEGL